MNPGEYEVLYDSGKVEVIIDATGIWVTALDDIPAGDGETVTVRILGNDGSDLSATSIVVYTQAAPGGATFVTLSIPDVYAMKKGTFSYVNIFTDGDTNTITAGGYNASIVDVSFLPGSQNRLMCLTALKVGNTLLTVTCDTVTKTIAVMVN